MSTKPRVAIIRGPNLNSWEMQDFAPLTDNFDLVGFTSYGHNYEISHIPFPVQKHFSLGQFLQARALRSIMNAFMGDYHDLVGLSQALRGFDIVHSAETTSYYSYQAARAKKKFGYKLVVTVWENIPFLYDSPKTRANKAIVFEETDLFLAVSERAKVALVLEGAPENKIKVLMPGINLEHFRPLPKDIQLLQKFGCLRDDLIILFVGNLYREKGIFDLLSAFDGVLRKLGRPSNVKLLIAGKGRDRGQVMKLIHRLSLEKSALLIGSFPYAMMPKIHALADIFALPSIPTPKWQEQFGYVLIESMACGKPVISTLTGSIPEVVADAGVLVPPNDFTSLSKALVELIMDETKRCELGWQARQRVKEVFDVQRVSKHIQQHYESLLFDQQPK